MRTPNVNALIARITAALAAAAILSATSPATAAAQTSATAAKPAGQLLAQRIAPDSLTKLADMGRIAGSSTARVWVVEISDFQCPYCQKWHTEVFPKIEEEFIKTGKIRFAFLNFPLSHHANSRPAAMSAMCASVQGKFWPMVSEIFKTQKEWENEYKPQAHFESLAKKTGLDVAEWNACLAVSRVNDLIDADTQNARNAGVQSTPSFIVAGRLVDGAVPLDDMRKLINDAIEAAGKSAK